MIKTLFLINFIFIGIIGRAQSVFRADNFNFSRDSLAQIYYDAVPMDPSPVFDVGTEVFLPEWSKFVRTLGRYLYDKHFQWGGTTKGNLDVFFNASGKIELLSIGLRDRTLTDEQWNQLLKLLKTFCAEYKFTISPKAPFSNSGSFQYTD